MRSLFNSAPFAKFDLGRHALSQQGAYSLTDLLDNVGLEPSDIDKIQDKKFRDETKADYDKCRAKGLDTTEGLACLAVVAGKVYAQLKLEREPAYKPPVVLPQQSEFPWVPVALGGALAAGLVYFLATRGK